MKWLANEHVFLKHAPCSIAANSRNIALKTRFLFLLNKCHPNSNLKKREERFFFRFYHEHPPFIGVFRDILAI